MATWVPIANGYESSTAPQIAAATPSSYLPATPIVYNSAPLWGASPPQGGGGGTTGHPI